MNGGRPCNIKTVLKGIKVEYLVALEILKTKISHNLSSAWDRKEGKLHKSYFSVLCGYDIGFHLFSQPL